MTRSAVSRLSEMDMFYMGYILEDRFQGHNIANELNEKYGDLVIASYDETLMNGTEELAINVMTLVFGGCGADGLLQSFY